MTRRHVAVAGTGRMGRDIGLWCLGHGFDVTWLSRDAGRLEAFRGRSVRDLRRLAAADAPPGKAAFGTVDDPGFTHAPDVLVETTVEDGATKRALLVALEPTIGPRTLVVSNSSSLLPSLLHPRCLGAHFFYPIALTGFAEAIVPAGTASTVRDRLHGWLGDLGLTVLAQDEHNAFAVNRLLLPLQNECFRLLVRGVDPEAVDQATSVPLGTGLLGWMDAVGLDVTAAAVAAYRGRMDERGAADLAPLVEGLDRLLSLGKQGRKNGDGLRCGAPLPWAIRADAADEALPDLLSVLFRHACRRAIAAGELDLAGLNVALSALFGVEYRPDADPVVDEAAAAREFALGGPSYWGPDISKTGRES